MNIGIWELLIILVIVLVLFGAKRLRTLGGDLGTAIKSFRAAVREGESAEQEERKDEKLGRGEEARTVTDEIAAKEKDRM